MGLNLMNTSGGYGTGKWIFGYRCLPGISGKMDLSYSWTILIFIFWHFLLYWPIFLFTSSSLAFFIAKTMSLKIRAKTSSITDENYGSADHHAQAHSKTQYVTWAIAAVQPMLVWILTYNFTWVKNDKLLKFTGMLKKANYFMLN